MTLPDHIGPYRPTRRIGAGGMGTVYHATDPAGGRPVAVKALHREFAADTAHRARFRREVDTLRKVTGPYLVPFVAADPDAPVPWLATAYVHGNTLHEHVREHGALTGNNLLTFAAAVAHALACIHAADVAHRDLKPTNVILAADGPRVLDFGIAHHLDATAVTATSVTTGTPGWMAPEQFSHGTTTPACDIFVWGVLVAYAAAAVHPFGTPTGITHRITTAEPSLEGLPEALLPLVTEALHKAPERRPSAADLAERAAALHGPDGTDAFPTLAYTQVQGEAPETGGIAVLGSGRWSIPLPPEGESAPPSSSAPPTPTVVPPPPPSSPPDVAVLPTQSAPSGGPWRQPVPPIPVPPRSFRRHAPYVLLAVAAAIGMIVAGAWAGGVVEDRAQPSASPAEHTTRPAAPEPGTPTPTASTTPDEEPTPEPEPEPEVVTVFGGLEVTVPTSFDGTVHDGTEAEDGFGGLTDEPAPGTAATEVDFAVPGEDPNGLRIAYSPDLTTDALRQGMAEGEQGVLGETWPALDGESAPAQTGRYETVISAKEGPLTDIGGKKALSWTVHTDVLPDYDGSRKNSHRMWWLPYSKYLLYTYGKHDKQSDRKVDRLLEGIGFKATEMPRDCADAIVALDKAAAGGEASDDHGTLLNCRAAAVDGAEQLDPGTVDTRTEAACVALAHAYSGPGADLAYGGIEMYKELRPWCDLPGAVEDPVVPDQW
ncbi:serine/threonine-protein kinase [Streptomyces macrosporus]|uniref:Protein kinase domain-containing protein n=1 Tax=Streptomyces macrosporus TaxID=44032 RepID=A0ABP5XH76_9ACTN